MDGGRGRALHLHGAQLNLGASSCDGLASSGIWTRHPNAEQDEYVKKSLPAQTHRGGPADERRKERGK